MRHGKHYYRAVFLLIGALFIFLTVRAFLIPKSFNDYDFYRGSAVKEQMDKPISFAAPGACTECHAEISEIHANKAHKNVRCQNCHAPMNTHIENGEFKELMAINRSPKLCLRCHRFLPSRPRDFPQIEAKEHTGLSEQDLTEGFCIQCHQPHSPSLGGNNE